MRYLPLPQWAEGHIFGVTRPDERFLHSREEWLGTLNAIAAARGQIVAVELGAGWGPWLVAAHMAARQRGIRDIKLVGVEGLAEHVEMMRQHFLDNGIIPESHTIQHAVVGIRDGTAWFPIVSDAVADWGAEAHFAEQQPPSTVPVRCISLATLLAPFEYVDFVHCDIQGAEAEVLPAAIDLLSAKVGRLIVGTHSSEIHEDLRAVFGAAGWTLEFEGPHTAIDDGTQVWINPRAKPSVRGLRRWLQS